MPLKLSYNTIHLQRNHSREQFVSDLGPWQVGLRLHLSNLGWQEYQHGYRKQVLEYQVHR
jgi:hypothetical protein